MQTIRRNPTRAGSPAFDTRWCMESLSMVPRHRSEYKRSSSLCCCSMLPLSSPLLWIIVISLLQVAGSAVASEESSTTACALISKAVSNKSAVFFPGSSEYGADILHFAVSAEQNSTCSVEPGSTTDVAKITEILALTRTPFAIKGGGHNLNPGFSSTPGVQLSMTRFNQITFHAESQTVDIGSGLIWDDVYAALEPYNVSVVGGRATGVGVAGLLLGGGYSYQTNQYGLAVDNIAAIELVLPSGEVKTVDETDEDLFFALRGGGNNFGIVTKFTLKTHPQTAVWGGSLTYDGSQDDAVTAALLNYTTNNTDPRTGLQCTYATAAGQNIAMVNLYYNEPTPPPGIFDAFLAIPALSSDISTRSLLFPYSQCEYECHSWCSRTLQHHITHGGHSCSHHCYAERNNFLQQFLASDTLELNGYVVEPFIPDQNIHPMNIYYAWLDSSFDEVMLRTSQASASHLKQVAAANGILGSAMYPNYALFGTPLEDLYGQNLARLQEIKRSVDPFNVMGLTGGFKL
ncbi:NAD(P)-binding protein [Mycena sanguinolenta]|uniref:NAD(P)-binding protein n=1 Tax=Mycena sanguinolenta TaxID=230812 RepID=A0A8H6Z5R1_9AGAR|nr:NAD(P)-binding protein [Mycena sanguinolenta]